MNGDGTTNTLNGIVERNGMFWLENVPLNGTSQISIQATDGSGKKTATTYFSVSSSSLILTINSTPTGDDLWQRSGRVSGTVSAAGASVTVNGVTVTANTEVNSAGSYNWSANNVPNNGQGTEESAAGSQGTAAYDASATANGQTTAANACVEKYPYVFISTYKVSKSSGEAVGGVRGGVPYFGSTSYSREKSFYSVYSKNPPLSLGLNYYRGAVSDYESGDNGWWQENDATWSDTASSLHIANSDGVDSYSPYLPWGYDYLGQFTHLPDEDEWAPGDWQTWPIFIYHYYADGVDWPRFTSWYNDALNFGFTATEVAVKTARTEVTLLTGGKSGINRNSVWCIQPWAKAYGRPPEGGWIGTPSPDVPKSRLEVGGRSVGSDGKLWVAWPDNSEQDITVTAPGVKHYDARPTDMNGVNKYSPSIVANSHYLENETPEFCVGENVTFGIAWNATPPYVEGVSHWTLPETFVNTNPFPYCPTFYIKNADFLNRIYSRDGTLTTFCWYVRDFQAQSASVGMNLFFSNGQVVFINASGQFSVYRPQVTFPFSENNQIFPVITNDVYNNEYLELGYDSGPNFNGSGLGTASFDAMITSAMPFTGKANWRQTNIRSVSPPFNGSLDTAGQIILDKGYGVDGYNQDDVYIILHPNSTNTSPYNAINFYDSPGIPIYPWPPSETVNHDRFRTYLQFYPDAGGIWVTLGVVTWQWGATENFGSTLPISPWTEQPWYQDTDEFPYYTQ